MAKKNGNGQDTHGIAIREQAGTYRPKGPKYNLEVIPADVQHGLATDFEEYVDQEGKEYLVRYVGYIDPRLVVIFSRNLQRKLTPAEIQLLGGPDGDVQFTCQFLADQAVAEQKVESFDDLSDANQRRCRFLPAWGLDFADDGVIVHLLNVMLDPKKPDQNDLARALASCEPQQLVIHGNKFLVSDESSPTGAMNATDISGKPWHIKPNGEVFHGHGPHGSLQKLLREMKARYECTAYNLDPATFVGRLRKQQEQVKQAELQRRVSVGRGLAARLCGKPEDMAQVGSPQ